MMKMLNISTTNLVEAGARMSSEPDLVSLAEQ
jgi:hypothetical protein